MNQKRGFRERFEMASHKNIMTAILLVPGPIATHLNVKNMSPAFRLGVSKSKFMSAATQLQSSGLGSIVVLRISAQAHVFVKRPPHEMSSLLELDEYRGLCSEPEYMERFSLPMPASVTPKMKQCLVELGIIPQELFSPMSYTDPAES